MQPGIAQTCRLEHPTGNLLPLDGPNRQSPIASVQQESPLTKTLQPPTMDRVCAKQGVWSPNPPFCSMRPQNPTEQADNLQNKGFGPCKLRGLPAIYRVLYKTQGWGETLLFGGKHCPLWGVGESWKGPKIEKIQSRLKFSIPLENFNLA